MAEQQQQQQQEEQSEQKKQNSGDEQKKIKRGEDKVDRGMKVSKKGLIDTQSIAGTRDFLPRDMRIQRWLFGKFQSVARMFSFEEYDAPILEPVELYTRKGGEDITNQMYDFKDKSGLRVSLRPEMTPSLARLVLKEVCSSLSYLSAMCDGVFGMWKCCDWYVKVRMFGMQWFTFVSVWNIVTDVLVILLPPHYYLTIWQFWCSIVTNNAHTC